MLDHYITQWLSVLLGHYAQVETIASKILYLILHEQAFFSFEENILGKMHD